MKKFFSFVIAVSSLLPANLFAQPCRQVIGYYPDWQWYDRSQLVNPMTIDYTKYTVINYCFFQPMANGTIALGDSWAEDNLLLGQYDWNLNQYIPNTSIPSRAHNAGTKVLVSIGGWTWSNNFPAIAADPVKRAQFAHDCNYYVTYYNLDGIDIDWEYPGYAPHGGGPADAANFTIFMQQIRDSLDALELVYNEQYLLTAAVGASPANMANINWPAVTPVLDMINLMSYDFFGAWDANANHNSPLYAGACGDPSFNIDSAFTALTTTYGVPSSKINIGVAFYGRTQTGFTSLCGTTSGNSATAAFPPDGVPLYYDIYNNISSYTYHWDNAAQVPWLDGNGVFVSYDDEQSIAAKANYINTKNACGAIIWEITGDYIETAPGSGVIAGNPLADTLNAVFCQNPNLVVLPLQESDIRIFPVPAKDQLTIQGVSSQSTSITVRDLSGRAILMQSVASTNGSINIRLEDFANGIYILEIFSEGQITTAKFEVSN
jgi:chitinase